VTTLPRAAKSSSFLTMKPESLSRVWKEKLTFLKPEFFTPDLNFYLVCFLKES